jgi:hypothetical protein
MDEIEQRLRESTDACIKSFEAWVKASKSLESREALMEAMHEVRKVVARVEIEIAVSERDRLGSRPLPIPPHRSQKKALISATNCPMMMPVFKMRAKASHHNHAASTKAVAAAIIVVPCTVPAVVVAGMAATAAAIPTTPSNQLIRV